MAHRGGPGQAQFVNHQQNNIHNETHNNNTHNEAETMGQNIANASPQVHFSMGDLNARQEQPLSGQFRFYAPGRAPVVAYHDPAAEFFESFFFQSAAWRVTAAGVALFQRRIVWWVEHSASDALMSDSKRVVNKFLLNCNIASFTVPLRPTLNFRACFRNLAVAGLFFGIWYAIRRWRRAARELAEQEMHRYLSSGYREITAPEVANEPRVYACHAELAAEIHSHTFMKPKDGEAVNKALTLARKFAERHHINPGAVPHLMAGAVAAAVTPLQEEVELALYSNTSGVVHAQTMLQVFNQRHERQRVSLGFFGALQTALRR